MSLSRQWPFAAAHAATLATALGLTGCNYVFYAGTDAAAEDATASTPDGVPATARVKLVFGGAEPTQLKGSDPSVSDDGLHLWFMTVTTPTDRDITHTQRGAANQVFPAPEQLNINTGANDVDGAITADQLLITFASNFYVAAGDGYAIYQARRQSPEQPFGAATNTNIVFPSFTGFDASPDGKQFFFAEGGFLRSNIRDNLDQLYVVGPATKLNDENVSDPTVSFDRLELVYVGANGTQLVRALLASDGKSYGAPQPFEVGVSCGKMAAPDFSPNAMLLTFSCDNQIYIARRPTM